MREQNETLRRSLPQDEGMYYWTEWNKVVRVFRRGTALYTRVYEHWKPVKITNRIAGQFFLDGTPEAYRAASKGA